MRLASFFEFVFDATTWICSQNLLETLHHSKHRANNLLLSVGKE
jgi:hypothetical protein